MTFCNFWLDDDVMFNKGSSYLLGQRVFACFVLKFASRRAEGEKREGM